MAGMFESILTIPAASAQETAHSLGWFGPDLDTGFLLFARVHRREHTGRAPPPARHNPISYEELARTVYKLAGSCDLEGYRGLFLAGGEAGAVFGDSADDYLSRRTVEVLEEALVTIGAHLASQPRYHGVRLDSEDRLFMQVRRTGNQLHEIDIGTVARMGAVVRLVEAPYQS